MQVHLFSEASLNPHSLICVCLFHLAIPSTIALILVYESSIPIQCFVQGLADLGPLSELWFSGEGPLG